MRRIITYGTFDTLHHGHIRLLRRAKELGGFLIVGLSTDEFNAEKGKKSLFTFDERKYDLEAIKYVDLIIPEHTWDQKTTDVQKHEIDIFTMGDDWAGSFDFLEDYCKVEYLKRTSGISSTKIRGLVGDC